MHWLGPGLQEARGPVLSLEAALVPGGSRSTPQAILLSLCTALSLAAGLGLRVGEHFVLTSPDKRVRGREVCQPPAHSRVVFSSGVENLGDYSYSVDDVIVLEIEVKGSTEPFQVLLEPYALLIPGESYIGITVKKDFKVRRALASFS